MCLGIGVWLKGLHAVAGVQNIAIDIRAIYKVNIRFCRRRDCGYIPKTAELVYNVFREALHVDDAATADAAIVAQLRRCGVDFQTEQIQETLKTVCGVIGSPGSVVFRDDLFITATDGLSVKIDNNVNSRFHKA